MKSYSVTFLMIAFLFCSCKRSSYVLKDSFEYDSVNSHVEELTPSQSEQAEQMRILQQLAIPDTTTYRIGRGDLFDIYIYDEPDLSTEGVYVKNDGTMSIKLIGEVTVENLTLDSSSRLIEQKMKKYLKVPKVTLLPKALNSAKFTIIGKVNKAGTFPIEQNTRLTDAIALAGGLSTGIFQSTTVEMADLEHSFINRNNEILPVNFIKAIREGDLLHNIKLKNGDYIYIPSSMNKEVFVIGEVNSQGYIGFKEMMTLMQAVTYAQGMTGESSGQAIIIRGSLTHPKLYSISIRKILQGEVKDIRLKPNDIVYLPKSYLSKWSKALKEVLSIIQSSTDVLFFRSFTP